MTTLVDLNELARRESEQTEWQLFGSNGAVEPWDTETCRAATVADLDLLAIRDTFQRMRRLEAAADVSRYLSHVETLSAFVPPLCIKEFLSGTLRPRNFTMLLFGAAPQRFIHDAASVLSAYPGILRATDAAQRFDATGTLVQQYLQLWRLLESYAPMVFDKTNLKAPNLWLYPHRALQEALVNAIVHRDYATGGPTRVTVYSDRIEIFSPGALMPGVSLSQLRRGRVSPRWRNKSLAWFFRELRLAQAEGQGVTTIRTAMKAAGSPPPRFVATEADVTCTLFAHPRARELHEALSQPQGATTPPKRKKVAKVAKKAAKKGAGRG
ncbi:MAG: ATP-binding protein [Byssovorax sp.]